MNDPILYRLIRSDRKTVAIQITPEGELVVRAPRRLSDKAIRDFVESKRGWIEKHMPIPTGAPAPAKFTGDELHALAAKLIEVLPERLAHFSALAGVSYRRVTVRNQHTRWGSCSSAGNLNFNCLLALVPEAVRDYVIVHELCHRKELNHSPAFWAEVERVMPDYRIHRDWLKKNGSALIRRLP